MAYNDRSERMKYIIESSHKSPSKAFVSPIMTEIITRMKKYMHEFMK